MGKPAVRAAGTIPRQSPLSSAGTSTAQARVRGDFAAGATARCLRGRYGRGQCRLVSSIYVQDIRRLDCGGGAVFDAKFYVDLFEMLVHRAGRKTEDVADVPVGLTLGDPE